MSKVALCLGFHYLCPLFLEVGLPLLKCGDLALNLGHQLCSPWLGGLIIGMWFHNSQGTL